MWVRLVYHQQQSFIVIVTMNDWQPEMMVMLGWRRVITAVVTMVVIITITIFFA
jgi:hypothetical protein